MTQIRAQKFFHGAGILTAGALFLWLGVASVRSQTENISRVLTNSARYIPKMLSWDDLDKLKALAPAYDSIIQAVNAYPPETRFYLVPCFEDSGNTGFWWWYLYLLTRYYSYPRIIFSHNEFSYENSKALYRERFIGQAASFNDIPWVKARQINNIILIRNNRVNILPATTPTGPL